MIKIKVPASTANMGTGFDSFATALNLYNTITVKETESGLTIKNFDFGGKVPSDKNNLIYRSIMRVFDYVGYERKGLTIVQKSFIPKTRGLGSSSACIIGGMVAGNILSGRKLSYGKILELATEMEGHPDNVAAALYGGFCISAKTGVGVVCKSIKLKKPIKYIALIPEYFMQTRKARGLLPDRVSLDDAATNVARAAGLATAFAMGDYGNLREYVQDKLHQPYRAEAIDGMYEVFEAGYRFGADAMYLSGSGPTIMALVEDNAEKFVRDIRADLNKTGKKYNVLNLSADNVGTVVKHII